MKHLTLFAVFTFFGFTVNAQMIKEMRYLGRHNVMFDAATISKPKHLKPIIEAKQDTELNELFRRYKNRRRLQNVSLYFSSFASPLMVFNQFHRPVINVVPLVVGSTGLGSALLIKRPSERALKDVIDKYNDLVLLEKLQFERELSTAKN